MTTAEVAMDQAGRMEWWARKIWGDAMLDWSEAQEAHTRQYTDMEARIAVLRQQEISDAE